ncbi:hypothetical protein GCM10011610_35440 [Nocardia rhizosphaerihabitans]|uniref:Uncharacterized protein n=1 Tax=Nocardia rhizosphaerihabitans TaxID=1691570 RepID=A0ABQ2KIE1_9NOCA|nr:hypothetical protein GCM10011610_35440 [Nocardia rhizosphaerihabitans]
MLVITRLRIRAIARWGGFVVGCPPFDDCSVPGRALSMHVHPAITPLADCIPGDRPRGWVWAVRSAETLHEKTVDAPAATERSWTPLHADPTVPCSSDNLRNSHRRPVIGAGGTGHRERHSWMRNSRTRPR